MARRLATQNTASKTELDVARVDLMDAGVDAPINIEDFPVICPVCDQEMRLFGIEWDTERVDVYTFVCDRCGGFQTRRVEAE